MNSLQIIFNIDQCHAEEVTFCLTCCFFLSANEVVGDKISLGVFSNETDWSQEKIDKKVRH